MSDDDLEAARHAFLADAAPRLPGGLAEAEQAWLTSVTRATLLSKQEPPTPEGDDVRYADTTGTRKTNLVPLLLEQIRAASPAAAGLDTDNPYLRILAEFLLVGHPKTPRWFRPDHDPQPGPEVTRLFDGQLYYERVDPDTWREEADQPGGKQGMRFFLSWAWFAGKIVVDATHPRVGSFKINKPSPGGPVADWQASTAGEVIVMLEQALDELRQRNMAGGVDRAVATRWTPSDRGPILMVAFGEASYRPGTVRELPPGSDDDQ